MEISDKWIGTVLLAGLLEKYEPMIMGLENSGISISADNIKMKLLQETTAAPLGEAEAARTVKFSKKTKRKMDKSKVRCYNCNNLGNFSRECTRPNVKKRC